MMSMIVCLCSILKFIKLLLSINKLILIIKKKKKKLVFTYFSKFFLNFYFIFLYWFVVFLMTIEFICCSFNMCFGSPADDEVFDTISRQVIFL